MKIRFNYGISTYSGTVDRMVYQAWYNFRLCLGRKFVYPTLTANNHLRGAIGKNLRSVMTSASVEYIADLKTYCQRNKQFNKSRYLEFLRPMPGPVAIFVKMMYAWFDTDPEHIDLSTVTVDDIVTKDADVRTLKRAVEAGFIPHIPVYEDLTSDIE